jgi:aminoglycoside/choline kinase family phosphotransferase/dTDP-glucose pyrophosphorylase
MKAMILAAGLGTRLLPLTEKRPKPLFPILGRPLIDILIRRLKSAGCEAVIINTHHLAHVIDEFVKAQAYGIRVVTRYEPTILGTGGAIKNIEDFWDDKPFLVVNGDIFTNIDFGEVYRFHLNHKHPVTLVLHDYPQFNHVWVDSTNHISGFGHTAPCPPVALDSTRGAAGRMADAANGRQLAFTGIHVLDPQVLSFIPNETFYNIIHAYCEMIRRGHTIKGFIARNHYWHDIGTITGYQAATRDALVLEAFGSVISEVGSDSLAWATLKGDGSDRTWYRVSFWAKDHEVRETDERGLTAISTEDNGIPAKGIGGRREAVSLTTSGKPLLDQSSVILVDHGPPSGDSTCEADAFAAIGRHLHDKGIPVPRIFAYDRPSGSVVLEDLGDLHLQSLVRRAVDTEEVAGRYRAVIDLLIAMGLEGAKGFDPRYAYQTPYYDRELILEKESRYFVEAFLNGYLGLKIDFETFGGEFEILAERALDHPYTGLLHRDFQSRNILVKDGNYYFIDFQGARFGPLPYDIASLLIDPYVELPQSLQDALLTYYLRRLSYFMPVDPNDFLHAYKYCAINRNLQILGAFAFLSRVKGKKDFETYIPRAVSSLKARLGRIEQNKCPKLSRLIQSI